MALAESGLTDEAARLAGEVPRGDYRVLAFAELAATFAAAGHEEAALNMTRSTQQLLSDRSDDGWERPTALVALVRGLNDLGRFNDGEQVAAGIGWTSRRVRALAGTATAAAATGWPEVAAGIAGRALALARDAVDPIDGALAAVTLVPVYARIGELETALAIVEQVERSGAGPSQDMLLFTDSFDRHDQAFPLDVQLGLVDALIALRRYDHARAAASNIDSRSARIEAWIRSPRH